MRIAYHTCVRRALATLLLVALIAGMTAPVVRAQESGAKVAAGRILVKFSADATPNEIGRLNARHGAKKVGRVDRLGIHVLSVPKNKSVRSLARAYMEDPSVEFAEPDVVIQMARVPNDPLFAGQWEMGKVSAPSAWDVTTGAAGTIVAVIDTGIESNHPDLAGRLLPGYDFANDDDNATDDNGHGTSCAGIAAANAENAVGIAGLNWESRLLPVKVLDETGNGDTSDIANGIRFAADAGADVISMSFASPQPTHTLQAAIDYAKSAGCVLVAAAGNDERDSVGYPAAFPGVIGVGAIDRDDALASWSNYGTEQDVVAPGVSVTTLLKGGAYGEFSGTSAATPFVSGLASLLLAEQPGLSAEQVATLISEAAVDLGETGWDVRFGWGRIDAASALAAAGATTPAPPPDPPPPVDTIAPTTAILGVPGQWTRSDVRFQLAAMDEGDGVADSHYTIDGGSATVYNGPVTVTREGLTEITYWSTDVAGNIEDPRTATARIDKSPPDVSHDARSEYEGAATIALTVSDPLSGVDSVDVKLDGEPVSGTTVTVDSVGAHVLEYIATDKAGNERAGSHAFSVQPPGGSDPPALVPERIDGPTRFSTAIAVARQAYPAWQGVDDVVIVSGDDRAAADPLTASSLCWAYDAPMLLVSAQRTPTEVKNALKQIADANGHVTLRVVGGKASLPDRRIEEMVDHVGDQRISVDRLLSTGGRYDLAAAIARRAELARPGQVPSVALFANGADPTTFFDALALSPISAATGAPILLLSSDKVPRATRTALDELKPATRIIGGGAKTVSDRVLGEIGAARWWGQTRYDTATAIADNAISAGWLSDTQVGVAATLPDALTGGSLIGKKGGVLLIAESTSLPGASSRWIGFHEAGITEVFVFGGVISISDGVVSSISELTD